MGDSAHRALGAMPVFASVGVMLRDSQPIGSGVLIAPEWILTDAHVVRGVDSSRLFFVVGGERRAVSTVLVHPLYRAPAGTDGIDRSVDLAVLRLASAIGGVIPADRYRGRDEVGREMTIVGFGSSSDALHQDRIAAGTKRAGTNVIDAVGAVDRPGLHSTAAHYLLSDFDSPTDSSRNVVGSHVASALEYAMAGGDSGGGGFVHVDGRWLLVSLNVRSMIAMKPGDLYGTVQFSTRLSDFNEWIDEAIARSSAK